MDGLKRLLRAQEGSVLVMSALALVSLLGMSGIAVELGNGYTAKVRNQRVADMAALSAAQAYTALKSTQTVAQALAAAQATANDVIVANGLATTTATIAPDSTTAPTQITVSITTSVPVRLASVITSAASYNVTNAATASLGGSISIGCVMALDTAATHGIMISGAASLNVANCGVATNSSIEIDGSASITGQAVSSSSSITITGSASLTAQTVTAGGAITKPQYSGTISGTQHANTSNSISDPLAGNADLTAAFAQLGQTTAPTTPVMPSAPTFTAPPANSDWVFVNSQSAYSTLAATNPVKANCSYSNSAAAFTCAAGTFTINNLTIPGGVSVTFAGPSTISVYATVSNGGSGLRFTGGSGSAFNFRNGLDSGSPGVVFGDGNVYIGGATTLNATSGFGNGTITIAGLLTTGGSSTVTIGAGTHAFAGITVGGSGKLTVGAGDLTVNGGITTGGSTTTSFGAGNYTVGKDSNGYSINHTGNSLTFGAGNFSGTGGIYVNGSSTLTFGTGNLTLGNSNSNGAISLSGSATLTMGAGNLNADGDIVTGGSSNIVFGVGTSHNIDGNLTLNGAATMGAGRYTIDGNFYKSASMGVTANNVTIIAAGTFYTGGSASMTLTAPTSSSGGGIAGIAFASLSSGASTIEGSSQNTLGGIFYMPNSNIALNGAGFAGSSTCFAMVVKSLTITGSSSANSGCTMPTVGSATAIRLIQ